MSTALPVEIEFLHELTSRLANIHVTSKVQTDGPLTFTYGSCITESQHDGADHSVAETRIAHGDSRLVWIIPEDAQTEGCISAWTEADVLAGRSRSQKLHQVKRRSQKRALDAIAMTNATGFDTLGAWFNGVEFLAHKEPGAVDVKAAKSKRIAIVGAGMSGLMTYLILHQVGFTNVTILEASQRLGGRVHTSYLSGGPSDYSYQEMGPMRFPLTYVDPVTNKSYNVSDFQLVYSLVEEMNRINKHDDSTRINFIPWIEENENGLQYRDGIRMPNGLPPTIKQISENASLSIPYVLDAETQALSDKLTSALPDTSFKVKVAENMYKAHREWINSGLVGGDGDHWSEFAFISQYLKGSLNSTDILGPYAANSFWETVHERVYELAATRRTIDGGVNRLPKSFEPLVKNITRMNTKIERVKYADNKVTLQWRDSFKDTNFHSSSFDYAVIGVPFTVVRQWRLPRLGATITNAIKNLGYASACKVALEYSERFWEKLENPIYGSCSTRSDIPGVGSICYPSYNLNASGPASILGSYLQGPDDHEIDRMMTMSEEEHVQYILDAVTEIHGEDTRKLYTGKYELKCWAQDPLQVGSWAHPTAGQHELYIPEYFKIHKNMIFVGEHTSYTHGWVPSALDSGLRGSVQLLLELGLVDEAKATVEKWMARWIEV
ncbi:L-amino-acid oxidase [Cladobotryum mycophilum]|uniref:L-amino-acid oxidase n=1 Tax=Cladobotryum mycophilum TaxID=491253 RepID=A0ABR0SJK6_9HYPO